MLILAVAARAGARALVHVDACYPCGSSVNTRQRWEKKEALIPLKLVRGGQRSLVSMCPLSGSPVTRAGAAAWARTCTCTGDSAAEQQVNVRHFISRLIRSFIMWRRGHTCLRLQGPAVHVAACTCMCAALFHLAGF